MYLDTAILVKLYVREPDSDYFAVAADDQVVCSSLLAYTEFWSALLGKERAGAIDSQQRRQAWAAFEQDVDEEGIRLEPLSPAIFRKANRILADCHPMVPLRSLDALHLATCDHLQEWPLCTTDVRMRQAAELLRFSLGDIPG